MSGVVGNGKCNVCVAKSSFWFYNTIVKTCAQGGHKKGKYDPTAWTSALKGGDADHTLQEYLTTAAGGGIGRPLLYHGTADQNLKYLIGDEGRVDFERGTNHKNQLSRGFYLTASPNEAKTYACQPKAANLGRVAVLVLDPGAAALPTLIGREEQGIFPSTISKTYDKDNAVMKRIRAFDTKAASFIRLKNKRNQFAYKGGASITDGTPAIAPKLVAVVLLGNRFQRLTETDEERQKIRRPGQTYVARCDLEGLDDADTIPDDYTWNKLGLAASCGKTATEKIPFCEEGPFQSFNTAGTLHTCSSKTPYRGPGFPQCDCSKGALKEYSGEPKAVPEGESEQDGNDNSGPVDVYWDKSKLPEQLVVADADADENDVKTTKQKSEQKSGR